MVYYGMEGKLLTYFLLLRNYGTTEEKKLFTYFVLLRLYNREWKGKEVIYLFCCC